MDKPAWQERSFEGRLVRFEALTGEEELRTSTGTRWAVFARVVIGSGLFKGAVYDKIPVYSPPLKAQLLAEGSAEGRLCKGAALEKAFPQWVVKQD